MPAADVGLELLQAYKRKRSQNPTLDRATLFKYLLWDRFEGRMVLDSELEAMARASANLYELSLAVLFRERPHMDGPGQRDVAEKELARFFKQNAPDQITS